MNQSKHLTKTRSENKPSYLIIDEWLFSYIDGSDGEDKRTIAFSFLNKLYRGKWKILVLKESPFEKKAYKLKTHSDPFIRNLSKNLYEAILSDTARTVTFQKDQVSRLPQNLANNVKLKTDDHYLLQLSVKRKNSCIITTDSVLIKDLKDTNIIIMLVDDFMKRFM